VTNAVGTVTHTDYDILDRPIAISINGTQTQQMEYDNGGVGDGNLTKITYHPGTGDFATLNWYHWRDRMVASLQGASVSGSDDADTNRPLTYFVLDNLGEKTTTEVFDGTEKGTGQKRGRESLI